MKQYRVTFFKIEENSSGEKNWRSLGSIVILASEMKDGCSLTAKAFRLASPAQQEANAVDFERI